MYKNVDNVDNSEKWRKYKKFDVNKNVRNSFGMQHTGKSSGRPDGCFFSGQTKKSRAEPKKTVSSGKGKEEKFIFIFRKTEALPRSLQHHLRPS